jgi:hypothetical protein
MRSTASSARDPAPDIVGDAVTAAAISGPS